MNDEGRPEGQPSRSPGAKVIGLSGRAWWTAADQAELDVLIGEFLTRGEEHRSRCPRCQAESRSGWPCPLVGEAWAAVEGWIVRRQLLSRAEYLRRLQGRTGLEAMERVA